MENHEPHRLHMRDLQHNQIVLLGHEYCNGNTSVDDVRPPNSSPCHTLTKPFCRSSRLASINRTSQWPSQTIPSSILLQPRPGWRRLASLLASRQQNLTSSRSSSVELRPLRTSSSMAGVPQSRVNAIAGRAIEWKPLPYEF
jgi:hypothetical protein